MVVGFFYHGKGADHGQISYLISPDRARTVSSPGHELKHIAEALRQGQELPENI